MSISAPIKPATQLEPLPRERLIDRAVAAIKDYIIVNRLCAGHKLPSEAELSRSLGVSRNVVRQALSSLAAVGIVRTEHGRGTFVAEGGSATEIFQHLPLWLDVERVSREEYFEVRAFFDEGLFRLVMARATDEELDRLEALARQMEEARLEDVEPLHDSFHLMLFQAAGNSFLASFGVMLYRFFWQILARAPKVRYVPPQEMGRRHVLLVQGLRTRDERLLPQLAALHLGQAPLEEAIAAVGAHA